MRRFTELAMGACYPTGAQRTAREPTTVCSISCCMPTGAMAERALRLSCRRSGPFELFQAAVVRQSVGPPAHELCWLTQPAPAVERGVGHLAHQRGRHGSPGRHGVVLPAQPDRVLLRVWT